MREEKNGIFNGAGVAGEWLDAIIENSFDGIYITDGKANTIKANRAYEVITGLARSEVVGRNMKDLVKRGIISESGSIIAIRERRPVTIQQEFKTGRKALITSTPVYGKDGRIAMVITNVRDLTEIYKLKEEVARKNEEGRKLRQELEHIQKKLLNKKNMVAVDEAALSVILLADKVAPMDSTVMLTGETGVGKEVFAEYIHQNSRRSEKAFIRVNCGAIPANLIESELFGYEKGAFTGADKNGKMGLFEVADHGTVFLDEIGELPLELQVKLLRVLQEQEVERIGGVKPIKIDVRVIAATNRNLEEMAEQKKFREDLYYRLMVFPIQIPPLRERKKDIIPLAEMFLGRLNRKYGFKKHFSEGAIRVMLEYGWPGNIRELKNIVERAVIINESEEISPSSLSIMPGPKKEQEQTVYCERGDFNLKSL
ncbi:sigma 54-interacting transcriptional regulator [Clostridium sp. AM58-1XD]|uniref:sigma-54 interaction domain-containing protein n=1 Tax=Clostridium sp. AM58-1XD TaxID=2292307 RepID=UPI001FA930BD|nr:sigma 54-interacting transcriptional regulator [Clostridium sp. AM58-1XD]